MTIELPFIPKSINELLAMNRFTRAIYTKETKETVAWLCKGIKEKILKWPVDVKILIISGNKQKKDCDNYTGKALIDGLVLGGILPDDNTDYVRSVLVSISYGSETMTRIELS